MSNIILKGGEGGGFDMEALQRMMAARGGAGGGGGDDDDGDDEDGPPGLDTADDMPGLEEVKE